VEHTDGMITSNATCTDELERSTSRGGMMYHDIQTIGFPEVGPETETDKKKYKTHVSPRYTFCCLNPMGRLDMPFWCLSSCSGTTAYLGRHKLWDTAELVHGISDFAAKGFVARATETTASKVTLGLNLGCCFRAEQLQEDFLWYEKDSTIVGNALDYEIKVFTINLDLLHDGSFEVRVEDMDAMMATLNDLAADGWALRTVIDTPGLAPSSFCCSRSLKTDFMCCLYRPCSSNSSVGDTGNAARKIELKQIDCETKAVDVNKKSWKRTVTIAPVELAIDEAYKQDQRLATVLAIESGLTAQRFFLFFESFVEEAQNTPHQAQLSLVSRKCEWTKNNRMMTKNPPGMPFDRSTEYGTERLRETAEKAGKAGWHVAEVFDTGTRESQGPTKGTSESLIVFDAPLALQQMSPALQPSSDDGKTVNTTTTTTKTTRTVNGATVTTSSYIASENNSSYV